MFFSLRVFPLCLPFRYLHISLSLSAFSSSSSLPHSIFNISTHIPVPSHRSIFFLFFFLSGILASTSLFPRIKRRIQLKYFLIFWSSRRYLTCSSRFALFFLLFLSFRVLFMCLISWFVFLCYVLSLFFLSISDSSIVLLSLIFHCFYFIVLFCIYLFILFRKLFSFVLYSFMYIPIKKYIYIKINANILTFLCLSLSLFCSCSLCHSVIWAY